MTGSTKNGWVSYWQPHADSELETAIVASKDYFINFETYDTELVDQSNIVSPNYLNAFYQRINNPLQVTLIK
ncbi:hypothetical protein VP395_15555 [Mariniflexile soesokkakense]|uniref:Uncharacterized protein n=1 Tax=Mariniflexile soesokkakense TaxID=1343160 RepID=A0ABV0ADJ7_9FLAO